MRHNIVPCGTGCAICAVVAASRPYPFVRRDEWFAAAGPYSGYSYGTDQASLPLDPLSSPLPVAAPRDWAGRERRVEWCLQNLTLGEKALLYRLLNEAGTVRLERCRQTERAERDSLTK